MENNRSLSGIAWNKTATETKVTIRFTGLDALDSEEYYMIEKYLIDETHGNLYYDYLNGNSSVLKSKNEKPSVVKTWTGSNSTISITDTLTTNSVAFYRLSTTLPDDITDIESDDSMQESQIVSRRYYSLSGDFIDKPMRGVTIICDTFRNRSVRIQKVIIR